MNMNEKVGLNINGSSLSKSHSSEKIYSEDDSGMEQPVWEDDTVPPSYDSIFSHLKDAKESQESAIGFFKKTVQTFASTIGCTTTLILLLALPTAMIVVGAEFKNDCPVEPFIPIYLIVGGAFTMLKTVTILCQRAVTGERLDDEPEEEQSMVAKLFDGVFNLFLFIWFIAGNFWIYSKYKPNFTPPKHQPLNYCHPTLYLFAFWVITTSHIILGIIFFCVCCLGMCASCTAFFVANATG